jgi:hypothetical protein
MTVQFVFVVDHQTKRLLRRHAPRNDI